MNWEIVMDKFKIGQKVVLSFDRGCYLAGLEGIVVNATAHAIRVETAYGVWDWHSTANLPGYSVGIWSPI